MNIRRTDMSKIMLAVVLVMVTFSSILSTWAVVGLHNDREQDAKNRQVLTEQRLRSELRSCKRDEIEALAIRRILRNAQEAARKAGTLTISSAIRYKTAIDSIRVPECTREALGFTSNAVPVP